MNNDDREQYEALHNEQVEYQRNEQSYNDERYDD